MTEEPREKKAAALLDVVESEQKLALLRDKIKESGTFLKAIGEDLIVDPLQYAYKKYTINQAEIDALVREWQELRKETEQLRKRAASFDLAV